MSEAEHTDHDVVAVDDSELVGSGGFPLRIEPAAALLPGARDPARLMVVWFVRKSFYWIFFIGAILATITHEDTDVEWTSPSTLWEGLRSWIAPILIALIVRFAAAMWGLALAYPLARAHEVNLSPRTNFGSGIGKWFDRLHVARAFRSLRWTHHVRQCALRRLGSTGTKVGKLDPIMDIANIATGVAWFITLVVVASSAS